MSSAERRGAAAPPPRHGVAADAPRRTPDAMLAGAAFLSLMAAVFPLVRVVDPDLWTMGAIVVAALVLAAGALARRLSAPPLGVTATETAVWLVLVTLLFLRDTAFLGVLPLPASIGQASDLVHSAFAHIVSGSAPLTAGAPLSFLIVASVGALAIVVDHVVITARMPLLAAVGLIAVSLIPAIAVPADVDVFAFVLLAASVLLLLRTETRGREQAAARAAARAAVRHGREGSVAAAAAGIGAIGVVVALVAAPLLPSAAPGGAGLGGTLNSIDPTLQLGADLRRPANTEVLQLTTDATSAPYLRAATLSSFDGKVWRPDTGRLYPLAQPGAFAPLGVGADVRVIQYRTDIRIANLVSTWLPVAYPATAVSGLSGNWGALPGNRTVVGTNTNTSGQHYSVTSRVPRPTLEQIEAAHSEGVAVTDSDQSLPLSTPEIVVRTAVQVTAGATTDYDKLIAMQNWFRSSEFRYSLRAPVEQGFDGTGVDAVAKFLQVREGYCIHFASAFALMARTLGMPSRIVVGYLPGTASTDATAHKTVYTVMSTQLHAWPEVYFAGIGWVPFEPTNSLGTPTAFTPASESGVDPGGKDVGATPAPSSSARPSGRPPVDSTDDGGSQASSASAIVRPGPWLATALAILLVLAAPALVREFRRRDQHAGARGGDAVAAWRGFQDTAIDLGMTVPAGESPRSFGLRMVAAGGAPDEATWVLIEAIERASYSPYRERYGPDLDDALVAVRTGMLGRADRAQRVLAVLAPRSLVVRPGSQYAAGRARGR